jgi:hypothetical protein
MIRDQHAEVPWSARQRKQVLPIPVEIRASVNHMEWNQQRALQEVTEVGKYNSVRVI